MRTVTLRLHAAEIEPADAYARLSDFARYPTMTDTVRSVVVTDPAADGSVTSEWTVRFRNGLLQWVERDVLDPQARTISFRQLSGDFHRFEGEWAIEPGPGGTMVRFEATFDLGIASLEAILDPIAESALRQNITLIVQGLLGSATEVVPDALVGQS